MGWYKVHEGVVSDSKWPLISRLSKQPKVVVVAVWMALLDHASQADERGSVARFNPREIDALLDLDDGVTQSVINALEEEKLIENQRIVSWEKRQGASASGRRSSGAAMTSTERVRAYRARKKQAESMPLLQMAEAPDETRCNVSETHETLRNVSETHETPDKIRIDNNILPPKSPHGGDGVCNGDVTASHPDGEDEPWVSGGYDVDMGFQEFFEAYPPEARRYKGSAGKAWKILSKRRELPAMWRLMESLDAWKRSDEWAKDGGRWIPSAERFLADKIFLETPHVWTPPKPQEKPEEEWQVRLRKNQEEYEAMMRKVNAEYAAQKAAEQAKKQETAAYA